MLTRRFGALLLRRFFETSSGWSLTRGRQRLLPMDRKYNKPFLEKFSGVPTNAACPSGGMKQWLGKVPQTPGLPSPLLEDTKTRPLVCPVTPDAYMRTARMASLLGLGHAGAAYAGDPTIWKGVYGSSNIASAMEWKTQPWPSTTLTRTPSGSTLPSSPSYSRLADSL